MIHALLCLTAVLVASGCARQDERLQQQQKTLQSLRSTTRAITEGWLSGSLSGTYTSTALGRTLVLIEQERTAVASEPKTLIDPRGSRLAASAEELERLIAGLTRAVRDADGAAARQHLASLSRDTGTVTP